MNQTQNLNPLGVLDHPIYRRLMELLQAHRFATTTQLARLTGGAYTSTRSATRQTLRHLNRLLDERLVLHLERRIGGWQGGSSASIWALTTRGLRTLTGKTVRQRGHVVSTSFLAHLLAITETRTLIDETIRHLPDTTASITTEPDCWRHYLGAGGQNLTLRPDLHAVVTSPSYQDYYFIEVDRDTENPARVITACRHYQAYYTTGAEQQTTGVFPVTLWVVPHGKRRDQLWRYITSQPDLDNRLFTVITTQQIPETISNGPPPNNNQTTGDQP